MQAVRFTVIAAAGLVFDLALAYGLSRWLGAPLPLAALLGFVTAALLVYAAHELWTFRDSRSRLSSRRAAEYLATATAALVVRVATVFVLERLLGPDYALTILILAAGASFVVNFVVSKFVVFARDTDAGGKGR